MGFQELKKETQLKIKEKLLILGDFHTFIRLRSELKEIYDKGGWGGGNFLQALGLLSTISFLVKVYFILYNPEIFITNEDFELYKSTLAKIKKYKKYRPIKHAVAVDKKINWYRRKGDINEIQAFQVFNNKLKENGIDLGIENNKESDYIWKTYRNALVHLAFPKSFVEVYTFTRSINNPNDLESACQNKPSFRKENERIICNADRLTYDVEKIAEWILSLLEEVSQDKIERLYYWLNTE